MVSFDEFMNALDEALPDEILNESTQPIIDEYIDQRIDLALERLMLANPELVGRDES